MGVRYEIDRGALAAVIEVLRQQAVGIANDLGQLELTVSTLRLEWSGEAQMAYDGAQQEWTQQMSDLNAVLQRTIQKLENILVAYTTAYNRMNGRSA